MVASATRQILALHDVTQMFAMRHKQSYNN